MGERAAAGAFAAAGGWGAPGDGATGSPLLTPTDVRELVQRLGLRPAKRLGQNFVVDPSQVRRIVAAARLAPGGRVVEIG
ncbi:MAG: hypothetical protein LBD70_02850, partial [Bifidobacteriaceae bacterium]|nr:hypothetical protein [Bifidobacteriaceae bacterium]